MLLVGVAHGLGEIALETRDAATARQHFQRELELAAELSNQRSEAIALRPRREWRSSRMTPRARQLSSKCVGALGDMEVGVACLMSAAELAAQRGETARATRLLAAADALREEVGHSLDPVEEELRARIVAAVGDAALAAAQSEGRAMSLDDALAYALEEHDPV